MKICSLSSGATHEDRLRSVAEHAASGEYDRLHVYPRDAFSPGHYRFEPGGNSQSRQLQLKLSNAVTERSSPSRASALGEPAKLGERVLNVIAIKPDVWWLGEHRQGMGHLPWPGGFDGRALPDQAVSRAYLKMAQAIDWSRLPIRPGQRCAELGCSPGGASQALLDRDLQVLGIDPASVHPAVADHPNFTHLRKRSRQVRRREFRKVRWLCADMNVAPRYTLDAVEEIIQHSETKIRGVILTLKLLEWKLVDDIPSHLKRVRDWGFSRVFARQLQYNRQEYTLVAYHPPGRQAAARRRSRSDRTRSR